MRLHLNDAPRGAYPDSFYAATATPTDPFPALDGDAGAEVAVVGGGYTGLSAALHLAERGVDVALIDAHRVGWGASGRNGGQLGSGQRREQLELEEMLGRPAAQRLWEVGEASKALVRRLVERCAIDAELTPGVLHADHRARFTPETDAEVRLLRDVYGYEAIRSVDRDEIRAMIGSKDYVGGALDLGAAHLHPLKLAFGLARAAAAAGARIFERTEALSIGEDGRIETAGGALRAGRIVLATNGYLDGLDRRVAARVAPINNFVLATEPLGPARARSLIRDGAAVSDSRFVVNYFRLSRDHRLLFGGGESYGARFPDPAATARKPMLKVFPQLADVAIDFAWGGTLGITVSRLPHFTRLSPRVWSASGYSGHGVGMATLAGKLIADAHQGEGDAFELMERLPTPRFPGGPSLRTPLLNLAMRWFAFRDRL